MSNVIKKLGTFEKKCSCGVDHTIIIGENDVYCGPDTIHYGTTDIGVWYDCKACGTSGLLPEVKETWRPEDRLMDEQDMLIQELEELCV